MTARLLLLLAVAACGCGYSTAGAGEFATASVSDCSSGARDGIGVESDDVLNEADTTVDGSGSEIADAATTTTDGSSDTWEADDSSALGEDGGTVTTDAGSITVTRTVPGAVVNLTMEGPIDWIKFATTDATSLDRRSSPSTPIGALSIAPSGTPLFQAFPSHPSFTWTDGRVVASPSAPVATAVATRLVGSSFSAAGARGAIPLSVKFYVGGSSADAKFVVAATDGASFSDTVGADAEFWYAYDVDLTRIAPGATLTINWTMSSSRGAGAAIYLQAEAAH